MKYVPLICPSRRLDSWFGARCVTARLAHLALSDINVQSRENCRFIHLQHGARQCLVCYRCFRSAGGLENAAHLWLPSLQNSLPTLVDHSATRHAISGITCCAHHCSQCDHYFFVRFWIPATQLSVWEKEH